MFEVIEDRHIAHDWVRSVLGVSRHRYLRLRNGDVLLTKEEVEKLSACMKEVYGVSRRRLFDKDAEVLPPGRRRRSKGTVTKGKETAA